MLTQELEFLKTIDINFTTLFVEDNYEVRTQTIKILKNILPIIISAKNGEEGIKLFNEHKSSNELKDINLIITDIQMPKSNGLQMISEIKKINPSIPIIITSAYSNTEYFLEAISLGVDNYILKPYGLENMITLLYKTLIKRYDTNISDITNTHDNTDDQLVGIGYDYFYDQFNKLLFYKDISIKLSKNENSLLGILIESKGQSVPYKTIEYHIWQELPIYNHSLRSLIYRFRTKTNNDIIQTVPSFGYKLPHFNI